MCKQIAEWIIYGDEPDDVTFTCTKHLSQMVADTTTTIEPYTENDIKCCHLLRLPRWLWFVVGLLIRK